MTWEYVELIRNGEWKNWDNALIADILECSVSTVQCVREFKTWN